MGRKNWRSVHYKVSQREIQRFWEAYAKIRPQGLRGVLGQCDPLTLKIRWDIEWAGPGSPSRVLACHGAEEVSNAYFEGFRVLRISPVSGERLTAEQAEILR